MGAHQVNMTKNHPARSQIKPNIGQSCQETQRPNGCLLHVTQIYSYLNKTKAGSSNVPMTMQSTGAYRSAKHPKKAP